MKLLHLSLEHFRNHAATELAFDAEPLHVLVGRNAAGKTNVLESIGLLSLFQSCRGTADEALIRWGSGHYRIRALVRSQSTEEHRLEFVSSVAPKRARAAFLDDVRKPPSSMLGYLPTVLFLPDDLQLFRGSPQRRRRFLDELLCQVSPVYARTLGQYERLLKQRAGVLRLLADGRSSIDELQPWDAQIAEAGSMITVARLELLETLNLTLPQELLSLGESWKDVRLVYLRKTTSRLQKDLAAETAQLLEHNRARDVAAQATTVGPHREDWHVHIGGRCLVDSASRGQERVCLLALLFLQVSYLELRRGETPVVLLDDVFSELDDEHQRSLLRSLSGAQVILTTTRLPPDLGSARVWGVEEGRVQAIKAQDPKHSGKIPTGTRLVH
jgi:DNA replication and repair protein RecF